MSQDLAIRLARATFNRALAAANLDQIRPLLTQNAVLITGTDSAVLTGRQAQLLAWKREFAAANRTVYTRTPATITLSPVEPIALEQGQWTGTRGDGTLLASGTYAAKWRRLAAGWAIEAEIYVTLG